MFLEMIKMRLTTLVAGSRACYHSQNSVQTKTEVYCTAVRIQVFTEFFGIKRNIIRMSLISNYAKLGSLVMQIYDIKS